MGKLQELTRGRIRAACAALGLSQVRVAEYLKVDKSIVSRLFSTGGTALSLDFIEEVSALVQRLPAELVSDPAATVQSVTPVEAQLLGRLREMTDVQRAALVTVIDWQRYATVRPRRASDPTASDAALLALYHALDADPTSQASIVSVMRTHPLAQRGEMREKAAASLGRAPQRTPR